MGRAKPKFGPIFCTQSPLFRYFSGLFGPKTGRYKNRLKNSFWPTQSQKKFRTGLAAGQKYLPKNGSGLAAGRKYLPKNGSG